MLIQFADNKGGESLAVHQRAKIPERKSLYLLPGEQDQEKRDRI